MKGLSTGSFAFAFKDTTLALVGYKPTIFQYCQTLNHLAIMGPTITSIKTRYRIPAKLLRPPVLVGREIEWAEMEKAWEAGRNK